MIIAFDQLHTLAGQVGMVDGGFDPLHRGHIEYFRSAAQLGVPVLCGLLLVRKKYTPEKR